MVRTAAPALPLAIGLQDGDGLFVPVLREGTPLPAEGDIMLSTRADYQRSIEFCLYQGLRPLCSGNLFMASFLLDDLEPAPRGAPRVRLSLRVETDGAVRCNAENLGTMTDMELCIRASHTLQPDEIRRLIAERGAAREQDADDVAQILRRCEAAVREAAAREPAAHAHPAASGGDAQREALARRFRIVETRSGGMGTVTICETVDSRRIAVKMLKPAMHWSREMLDRFEQEAQIWISLGGHGNIVRAYQVERVAGHPCLVLEYVDGGTLRQRRGQLPPETAIDCAIQCARGLRFALSRHGIVHRDVKPGNVLLAGDGTAKVTDFGLASGLARQDAGDERARRGGHPQHGERPVHGTPAYMAPERFVNPAAADCRADIYSLAVLTYELLAGRLPFYGNTMKDMLKQRLGDPPIRPSNINRSLSPRLDELLLRCLADKPDRRPADYEEPIAVLEQEFASLTGTAYARSEILEPTTPWSLLTKGLARHALGDYQGAIDCFEEASRLNPRYEPPLDALPLSVSALRAEDLPHAPDTAPSLRPGTRLVFL